VASSELSKNDPHLYRLGVHNAHCWGLALADFGRDLRSSDYLRGSRNFVFFSVR